MLGSGQVKGRHQGFIGPGRIQTADLCEKADQLQIPSADCIVQKAVSLLIAGFHVEGVVRQLLNPFQITCQGSLKSFLSVLSCG